MFETGNGLLLGALTFGMASILYVFYGPSPTKSKRKSDGTVSGLLNYGNHCFINAVLQSLAACESMVNWLQYSLNNGNSGHNLGQRQSFSTPMRGQQESRVTSCLLKTLQMLNNGEVRVDSLSPVDVLHALKSHRWAIPNEEQDAHELFNVLTSSLESELYSSLPMYSLKDALLIEEMMESPTDENPSPSPGISTRGSHRPSPATTRIPKSLPTRGLLASQLQCKTCGYKYPVHLDTFDTVSLAIPSKILGGSVLLQDCLNKFVSNEIVHEVNCEGCSASGAKASFVKRLTFAKLPQLLCFHVQRLVWLNNGMPMKRSEHVAFPEYLNMDEYVYCGRQAKKEWADSKPGLLGGTTAPPPPPPPPPPMAARREHPETGVESHLARLSTDLTGSINGTPSNSAKAKYRYRLCSSIVHLGDAQSGHFITYRRGGPSNHANWYYTSDVNVRETGLRDVLSSFAYMLFYERIH